MYNPQNQAVFTAALSGTLAGMAVSGRINTDPVSANYANRVEVAGAFAQEFDTLWGNLKPTTDIDVLLVAQCCSGLWQGRLPEYNTASILPSTYFALATALIALINATKTYFTGLGLTPVPALPTAHQVTFMPGVPSGNDHVETWPEVELAIAETEGLITVIIDNSHAPAIVPATADTECFGKTVFSATLFGTGQFEIADGGRLKNVGIFDNNVILTVTPTAVSPLYYDSSVGVPVPGLIIQRNGAIIMGAGSLVPAFEFNGLTGFVIELNGGATLDNFACPLVPMLPMLIGMALTITISNALTTPPLATAGIVTGDATAFYAILHDPSISPVPVQTGFLGTYQDIRTHYAAELVPAADITGNRPLTPQIGQMFFDTTLGIPAWWDGANWVDATGGAV